MLNEPKDLVGNVLYILLARQFEDDRLLSEVKDWRMTVVLDTDYYPVTLTFADGITIERGAVPNPTIILGTTFDTIVSIAAEEMSPVRGLINRKLRIRGLLKHPRAAFRFYRLIVRAMGV